MVTVEESDRVAKPVQIPHHELQLIEARVSGMNLEASHWKKDYRPEQQPVMCDFDIVKHDTTPSRFYVSLLLELENSRKERGVLQFYLISLTEFEFRPNAIPTSLPEDEQVRWHLFSVAVATAISMARGHLTNYLAPTIYRSYTLPMLNVQELVNKRYAPPALPTAPATSPSEKPPRKPTTRKPRE